MTPERWQQIQELFDAARTVQSAERQAFLIEACSNDEELHREVEWMLAHQNQAERLMGVPAMEVAALVLADGGATFERSALGPYEDLQLIGRGGMGEVYRARDRKLSRYVAIEVLPEVFAGDGDRLARFQREAEVLAALNHPNISIIHDIQEDRGIRFLVLEFVEGETPAARLNRGPIAIDEALALVKQVAEALEAAHEKGILHRDLKPANVSVTPEGRVKVLDFGLAKMIVQDGNLVDPSKSPTFSLGHTAEGVILGTAAYMSPEQASGRVVDKRSDIWSFGCLLYEVLTGKQAFGGDNVADVMASVMKSEPDYSLLPAATPAAARSLLRRCLHKQPKHRLHDISDVRIAIEDALTECQPLPPHGMPAYRTRPRWMIPVFAILLMSGLALGLLLDKTQPAMPDVTHVQIGLQPADQLDGSITPRPSRTAFAVSPDGRSIVFSATRGNPPRGGPQLFSRDLAQSEATPISGTEGGLAPFFSPDGQWIGFFAEGQMRKVPAAGGPPVNICPVNGTFGPFGASWGDQGLIFFADQQGDGIFKVSSGGGTPVAVTRSDVAKGEQHVLPHPVPGGKQVMFTIVTKRDWEDTEIVVQSLETAERRVLLQGAADVRYVPTGHLVYMKRGTLMAVPFDVENLRVTGDPIGLIENVMQAVNAGNVNNETGAGQWSLSNAGTLVYVTGGIYPNQDYSPVWVDRTGNEQELPSVPIRSYIMPRLSPEGDRMAITITGRDLWLIDILRGDLARLTFDATSQTGSRNNFPVWSPDGKRLVYGSNVSGISNVYVIAAAGGKGERITSSAYEQYPSSWSAHGSLLAFLQLQPPNYQIWVLPMDGDRKPKLFLESRFILSFPEFSPDGRWIAYVSRETGVDEVYVRPYPGPGEKRPISIGGGGSPMWTPDGGELLYRAGGGAQFFSVRIKSLDPLRANPPRLLFTADGTKVYGGASPVRNWDVSKDGARFLLLRREETKITPITQLQVVLNWTAELKRAVAKK